MEGVIDFIHFDATGKLWGLKYSDGNTYFYVRNAQGDIIKLVNGSGTVVVEYAYDAWGNPMGTTGSMAGTLGADNPFRYRGYYFDTETGLYYLQSRYYNPQWGRYISTDTIAGRKGELLGHNLYVYCKNNPVNLADPSGHDPLQDYITWIKRITGFGNYQYNEIKYSLSPKNARESEEYSKTYNYDKVRTNSILGFVVDVVSLGANLQRPDTVLLRRIADASSISAVTRVINFVLGDPAKDSRGANYVDFGDTLYVFEFTAYNSNHIFSARYVAVYTNEDNLKYHNSYILIDFSPVDMGGAIHE